MSSKHEHYKNWLSEVCDRSQSTLKDLGYEKVVRCQDCQYGHYDFTKDIYWCANRVHPGNWFCAGGKRR